MELTANAYVVQRVQKGTSLSTITGVYPSKEEAEKAIEKAELAATGFIYSINESTVYNATQLKVWPLDFTIEQLITDDQSTDTKPHGLEMLHKKVIGNWGANFPIDSGTVIQVHTDINSHRTEFFVGIEWESGSTSNVPVADIKKEGETTANGSPIGIFWETEK